MLSSYDRALKEWKRVYVPGLKARLERERPPDHRHIIPSACIALLIKRAKEAEHGNRS